MRLVSSRNGAPSFTTEGMLDVAGTKARLTPFVATLSQAGIRVSLFIDPDPRQVEAAKAVGAPVIELHTGAYCEAEVAPGACKSCSAWSPRPFSRRNSASNVTPVTGWASRRWARLRRY